MTNCTVLQIQIKRHLERAFWLSPLPPSALRACHGPSPLGKSALLIRPLPMDTHHNLPNTRGLSAHGLHILPIPDRGHSHFLEIVIR